MNLPNVLTMSRFVFTFFIVLLLLSNTLAGFIFAAVLFIAASLTDFYDGYLAKKRGISSDFGKIMDPIADKVLILCVFGMMVYLGMVNGWMVLIIAAREIAVTVSRLQLMSTGKVLAAEAAGKIKTICQILSIIVILSFLIVEQSAFAVGWFYKVDIAWRSLINVLMVVNVILTVGSGAAYFRNVFLAKK